MGRGLNETDFRCIHCGSPIKLLYVQYSPGNIHLMKCEVCKEVVDEYIECEKMILVIDLVLHKEKAYRHLFYNRFTRETLNFEVLLWRLLFGFLLLDAYKILVLSRSEEDWKGSMSFASIVWGYGKLSMDVFLGNLMFLCMLLLGTRVLLKASVESSRSKDILLAILVSSYFKIFLITSMIWEFPSSVFYISDLIVLSSNTVALKAVFSSYLKKLIKRCFLTNKLLAVANRLIDIWRHRLGLEVYTDIETGEAGDYNLYIEIDRYHDGDFNFTSPFG